MTRRGHGERRCSTLRSRLCQNVLRGHAGTGRCPRPTAARCCRIGPGEGTASVAAPRYAQDSVRMSFEDTQALAAVHVPQTHGVVVGPGEGTASVAAPRYAPDAVRMSFEDTQALAAVHVPQPHGVVVMTRRGHGERRCSTLRSRRCQNVLRGHAGTGRCPRPTAARCCRMTRRGHGERRCSTLRSRRC
jgi:hypothetical protein